MAYTVGDSTRRIDATAKVKGEALYPGDIELPDMVFMKVLFANRPHAIIHKIETARAEQLPGVLAVYTAKDVPNNEYGLISPDQPVLCGPGSNKPFGDRVRFIGDQVALVVAVTEAIAEKATALIDVAYEDLPVVTDPRAAMNAGAPLLFPDRESNVFCHYRIRKGNVDAGLQNAAVVVEGYYQTPAQEHAFLQPEAGVSYLDEEGRITVVVAGQWTHEDQAQIAHALNLPPERVRVIYPAIGGAFGGREDMSVQIILALATLRLSEKGIRRPVKIVWSREESMIGHHKRHPYFIKSRWGATRAGKIVAADVEIVADGGAYMYTSTKVLGNATLMCTGPYEIPNVRVDSYGVYTNNIPSGAFRGFGGPQGAFAAESQMNRLAEALGMDPVEIRMRNLLHEGSLLSVGTPVPKGVSIDKVVATCAVKAGWVQTENGWHKPSLSTETAASTHHGLGFACSFKNVGFSFGAPENCWATIELRGHDRIEEAVLYHSGAEVGQGSHTVFVQIAAKALGLPLDKVRLIASDTAFTPDSGSASASRTTFMAGNAIRGAARLALKKWNGQERPATATYQYWPPKTSPYDSETGACMPNFAYGYVAEAIEVSVDVETGQIHLQNVVCADDVGNAINPQQVQGQIEGAIVQAAGYAVLENFIQQDGLALTKTLSTYLIPTVLDIPDHIEAVVLEYPDPLGPYGVRGMGEMPFLPLAPAVAAAVHEACGIWFDRFPLTPERVFSALETRAH